MSTRSLIRAFPAPALAILLAVVTGIAWLGKPLRLVELVTIIGLGMSAGVSFARAVGRVRAERSRRSELGNP